MTGANTSPEPREEIVAVISDLLGGLLCAGLVTWLSAKTRDSGHAQWTTIVFFGRIAVVAFPLAAIIARLVRLRRWLGIVFQAAVGSLLFETVVAILDQYEFVANMRARGETPPPFDGVAWVQDLSGIWVIVTVLSAIVLLAFHAVRLGVVARLPRRGR